MQPAKALGQSPRVDAVETIDGLGVLDGEIEQLLSTPHRREREHPSEHAHVNFLPENPATTDRPPACSTCGYRGWTFEEDALAPAAVPHGFRPPALPGGGRAGVPAPARVRAGAGVAAADRLLAFGRPLRADRRPHPLRRCARVELEFLLAAWLVPPARR